MPFDAMPAAPEDGLTRLDMLADRLDQLGTTLDMNDWRTCASGIAASMPEFAAAGFCLIQVVDPQDQFDLGTTVEVPSFGVDLEWAALEAFFQIDWKTSGSLFWSDQQYVWSDDLAFKIRQYTRLHWMARAA